MSLTTAWHRAITLQPLYTDLTAHAPAPFAAGARQSMSATVVGRAKDAIAQSDWTRRIDCGFGFGDNQPILLRHSMIGAHPLANARMPLRHALHQTAVGAAWAGLALGLGLLPWHGLLGAARLGLFIATSGVCAGALARLGRQLEMPAMTAFGNEWAGAVGALAKTPLALGHLVHQAIRLYAQSP